MNSIPGDLVCPLCQLSELADFFSDKKREYYRCLSCQLIFVPPYQYLLKTEEKAIYDTHQNISDDQEYRRFLNRLVGPLEACLAPRSNGLDFGSGPGPTLSVMFAEKGHTVALYDYFYSPDKSIFDKQYDFICATEVVEHLHQPKFEFDRLWRCLKPGGHLGIMTRLVVETELFVDWFYKNDPTHVCFFSRATFKWLADACKAVVSFEDNDVMIFVKPS